MKNDIPDPNFDTYFLEGSSPFLAVALIIPTLITYIIEGILKPCIDNARATLSSVKIIYDDLFLPSQPAISVGSGISGSSCSDLITTPSIVRRTPPSEAVYLMDDGHKVKFQWEYLMNLLEVVVVVMFALRLRRCLGTTVIKARDAIINRWKNLVGIANFEVIVQQQRQTIQSLYIHLREAKNHNLLLTQKICDARAKKSLACIAFENQIAQEREENAARLDRTNAVVMSTQQQLIVRDDDYERLQQDYDDAQARNASLHDQYIALQQRLAAQEKIADATIASLSAQLQTELPGGV
ncbi:hypothetical protein NM688_g1560 [Phlebia brevispora]|uniref:Uncharacterized protein n=1 Tax=Phlebia brevispora TaxID=194682 RepID=A0ACC1TBG0_9APHY|nr:hypothetical protein NM688_g1560 [Phlebia brevispora]